VDGEEEVTDDDSFVIDRAAGQDNGYVEMLLDDLDFVVVVCDSCVVASGGATQQVVNHEADVLGQVEEREWMWVGGWMYREIALRWKPSGRRIVGHCEPWVEIANKKRWLLSH
jgi:hypothetical protein